MVEQRRVLCGISAAIVAAFLLGASSGTPEQTAKWYFSDKPKDERVPVTDQSDPGAAVAPDPNVE